MYKKTIFAIIIIMSMFFITFVFAQTAMHFDAYEFNARIYYNNEELTFDLPIVTINGYSYIPLREAAEKANIDVEWDEGVQKVILNEKSMDINDKESHSNPFGFKLPDTAKILNYDYYVEDEETYCIAKISFEEKDMETVKKIFQGWGIDNKGRFFNLYNEDHPWWDLLDSNEIICGYSGFKTGVKVKSIEVYAYITNGENGQYYLYVVNG